MTVWRKAEVPERLQDTRCSACSRRPHGTRRRGWSLAWPTSAPRCAGSCASTTRTSSAAARAPRTPCRCLAALHSSCTLGLPGCWRVDWTFSEHEYSSGRLAVPCCMTPPSRCSSLCRVLRRMPCLTVGGAAGGQHAAGGGCCFWRRRPCLSFHLATAIAIDV